MPERPSIVKKMRVDPGPRTSGTSRICPVVPVFFLRATRTHRLIGCRYGPRVFANPLPSSGSRTRRIGTQPSAPSFAHGAERFSTAAMLEARLGGPPCHARREEVAGYSSIERSRLRCSGWSAAARSPRKTRSTPVPRVFDPIAFEASPPALRSAPSPTLPRRGASAVDPPVAYRHSFSRLRTLEFDP